jgi:hypothetical protein
MGSMLKTNPEGAIQKAKSEKQLYDAKSVEQRVLESTPLLEGNFI